MALLAKALELSVGFIAFALLGSILPDAVERWIGLRHRSKAVHNFASALPIFLLSLAFEPLAGLAVGWLHHIAIDSTTTSGCYVLSARVRGPLKSNNPWHGALISLLHAVFALPALIT